jgi:hypothetical protein
MALERNGVAVVHRTRVVKATQQDDTVVDQSPSLLPVDSGLTIDAHVYLRQIKGEDIAFNYRADPALLGRPMPKVQVGPPEDWKLNFDVFIICDGHSGRQVCTATLVGPNFCCEQATLWQVDSLRTSAYVGGSTWFICHCGIRGSTQSVSVLPCCCHSSVRTCATLLT